VHCRKHFHIYRSTLLIHSKRVRNKNLRTGGEGESQFLSAILGVARGASRCTVYYGGGKSASMPRTKQPGLLWWACRVDIHNAIRAPGSPGPLLHIFLINSCRTEISGLLQAWLLYTYTCTPPTPTQQLLAPSLTRQLQVPSPTQQLLASHLLSSS
jgi:hypothetical protein